MIEVFAGAENIISSLGLDVEENINNIIRGNTGIEIDTSGLFFPDALPLSKVDHSRLQGIHGQKGKGEYTFIEQMFIHSIQDSLSKSNVDISSPDTLIIIATTKGNIHLLNPELRNGIDKARLFLPVMAKIIGDYFKNPNTPLIVSNACISGVVAIIYGERLIRSGKYKRIIVSGGDMISEFIVSGFQSFQSLSMNPCRPFDKKRDGLSLGEGCGTIILSSDASDFHDIEPIKVLGGAISNDANHISGPSRDGKGLLLAVENSLEIFRVSATEIDSISAHGTATVYNDEMEAKVFSSASLEKTPINSYKGYIGHTLGAAGVIESAISLKSMRMNRLFRSAGYEEHGVSKDVRIIKKTVTNEIRTCLKTASGFGGSNAAIIFSKH